MVPTPLEGLLLLLSPSPRPLMPSFPPVDSDTHTPRRSQVRWRVAVVEGLLGSCGRLRAQDVVGGKAPRHFRPHPWYSSKLLPSPRLVVCCCCLLFVVVGCCLLLAVFVFVVSNAWRWRLESGSRNIDGGLMSTHAKNSWQYFLSVFSWAILIMSLPGLRRRT